MNTGKLLLENELKKIKSQPIKDFVQSSMNLRFPKYFWIAPASIEYHPEDERRTGGLVLHVRRLIKLIEALGYLHELTKDELDILIAAAILHDSWQKGLNPSESQANNPADIYHPLYVRQKIPFNAFADKWVTYEEYESIMECVVSHMGRFSVDKSLDIKKKLPDIFKVADFVCSRENILVS